MNTNLKKRKKAAFNTYKAVRTSISLNSTIFQPVDCTWQQVAMINNWENNWIEQATEFKSEISTPTQTIAKQNKLITKWWENN